MLEDDAVRAMGDLFAPQADKYLPERIEPMLDVVSRVWKENPHLRLGQLMVICGKKSDIFYVEDEEIIRGLMEFEETNNFKDSK